ncbi:hypothetical protein FHS83_000999 [Rhizomicrobium palustre]|uniref:DUF6456 domain-containing protein n=1 Tax=Rhizomicrobium palustre TaxID=189966 RepID=A0A846MX09_9PROT|nr:DUF6456 domain-containing protein [Rhizomicrobium palustre]NIK87681.1 hypothetical protein [Rhizomicrobium palustre]
MSDATEIVLQKLSEGGKLRPFNGACFVVVGLRGKRRQVTAGLVEQLLRRGLVKKESGGEMIVLAKAGEDWLSNGGRFAEQHRLLETAKIADENGREHFVVINAAESPLALLTRLGWLTPPEVEAGEKLRRDYTIGQLTQRLGVNYAMPIGGRSHRPDMAETTLAARQRFNAAMKAAGPGLSELLFDICCYLKGLEESEKGRGWPRGSAKVVLKLALTRLAAHYGFGAPDQARMRGWQAEEK